jgi:hypothetical protein
MGRKFLQKNLKGDINTMSFKEFLAERDDWNYTQNTITKHKKRLPNKIKKIEQDKEDGFDNSIINMSGVKKHKKKV